MVTTSCRNKVSFLSIMERNLHQRYTLTNEMSCQSVCHMTNKGLSRIAKEAGCSIPLVSMALNNRGRVSPGTRKKIKEIARKLGYVPNSSARSLVTKRTNIIGIIYFSDVHHLFSNMFFSVVLESFAKALDAHGYYLIVARHSVIASEGGELPPFVLDGTVDGVALVGPFQQTYLKKLQGMKIPVVLIDSADSESVFDSVTADNIGGAAKAVSYLLQCGRKRILYLRTPGQIPQYEDRYAGYLAAHREHGVKTSKSLYVEMEPSAIPTGLISIVRHQKCDAVFCCNDLAAIITVQHLREGGISVPEHVSVVGFDDVEQARMCAPPLTTVSVPKEHMGHRSAELLLHRLLNSGIPCRHEVLPVDLILRDSVCQART